jgi:hypothetical protein
MLDVDALGGEGLGAGALDADALGAAVVAEAAVLAEPCPQPVNIADATHTIVIATQDRTRTSRSSATPASPSDDNTLRHNV